MQHRAAFSAGSASEDEAYAAAGELHRAGRLAEAAEAYRTLTRIRPTFNLIRNLAFCLARHGDLDEALHWLGVGLRHRPDDPGLLEVVGEVSEGLGRMGEAEAAYRRAVALGPANPDHRFSLASFLLSDDRWAEGLPLFEARREWHGWRKPPGEAPEWRGEPLDGRSILIWREQGQGDQICFARFAPLLKEHGAGRVVIACAEPLVSLLAKVPGVDEAVSDSAPAIGADCWVYAGSIPLWLGLTPETLPSAPYLAAWPQPVGARIGIRTRGNPAQPNDVNRSLPSDYAEQLLALPGVMDLDPAVSGAADFAETAAIVAGLDLVISVDTSVAHLAGALGKPVWVLLPHVGTDWRWRRGRMPNAWYPTARLFRQPAPRDWATVVASVEAALRGSGAFRCW